TDTTGAHEHQVPAPALDEQHLQPLPTQHMEGMRDDNKTQIITGRRGTMPPPSQCPAAAAAHPPSGYKTAETASPGSFPRATAGASPGDSPPSPGRRPPRSPHPPPARPAGGSPST